MKSKAILLIAVCLSLTVILSGCVDCEADSDCENGEVCDADGVCVSESAGVAGMAGKFVLPVDLWQNESFTVDFQVENTGEADVGLTADAVPTGTLLIYLGGVSLKDYGANTIAFPGNSLATSDLLIDRNTYALYAVRDEGSTKIPGGMENLNFGTTTTQLKVPAGYKDVKATFEATMCYPYKTIGVATVCTGDIKPGEEGVCKSNEDKAVESSMAPVVITSVRQAGARASQTFTIKFENKGAGTPYVKPFTGLDTANCVTSLAKIDRNYVKVTSVKVGETGTALDCSGPNVNVSMAAGTVNCHYTGVVDSAVSESQLLIELNYNYKDKVTEEYTIKGV